ncbi:hypothetical protein FHS26_006545 [Rhizobium pisi]|uniref:Exopolysaccharide synthesis protein n=2 Tax=Rhizobium pisi TaxID=574561 RepID=A0A7W5BTK7_9HYPH|nr:hypothetical protein [Rhizobium pisi]
MAACRPTPLVTGLRGDAVGKVLSAVGPPRDSPPRQWKFPMRSNRRWLVWAAVSMSVLLLAAVAFYWEIRHSGDPIEGFEDRALDKAARSSRIAAGPYVAAPRPISISRHLVEIPKFDLASQFLRVWLVSGANICGALREAGIEVGEWKAASMRNRDYECYFQRVYERDEVRPLSSTFVKVRGNETGDLVEIRAKIVGPKVDVQGRLAPAVLRIFETIVKQACWRDFEDTLASIQSLRDVEYERFGAYLSFTREAGSENSFNFALGLKAASASQARTRAYFSTDRWLATTNLRIPKNSSASTATARPDQPIALDDGASTGRNPGSSGNCG